MNGVAGCGWPGIRSGKVPADGQPPSAPASVPRGQKKPRGGVAVPGLGFWRLAIPYFRMANCHTIIGAKRFHFRVRDGIGWFTLAMVTKQTGVVGASPHRLRAAQVGQFALPLCCTHGNLYDFCPLAPAPPTAPGQVTPGFGPSGRPPCACLCPACVTHQAYWVLYGQASRAISTR